MAIAHSTAGVPELTGRAVAGRRTFLETYERPKSTIVTHPPFGYKMSYGRMLEAQARLLSAYILGDVPAYQGLTVR